jgi:hypothetical protein
LVTGEGWTKPYSGTNTAVYQQAAGNQFYLWVNDNAPSVATDARIRGYEVMSSADDSGTGPFPTATQFGNGIFCRKSNTANGTTRNYKIFADDRTAYVFIKTGDSDADYYSSMYFGDYYSYMGAEGYRTAIAAKNTENSSNEYYDMLTYFVYGLGDTSAGSRNPYCARGYTGLGSAVNLELTGDVASDPGVKHSLSGRIVFPSGDGRVYAARVRLFDRTTGGLYTPRGYLRGFWQFLHPYNSVTDGDTINGTGTLSGRTFEFVFRSGAGASGHPGVYMIETSDTLDTNA